MPSFNLKRNIDLLRRTCREAAALIISREDRVLGMRDRIALKLHLLICGACPKFENQVLTMRAALERWRHHGQDAEPAGAATSPERPAK